MGAPRSMNNPLNVNVYAKANYVTDISSFSNYRVLTQKLRLTRECNTTARLPTSS